MVFLPIRNVRPVVHLEAPDKFGSTWLAKCQETHEGARRSNRPGGAGIVPGVKLGISDLEHGLDLVNYFNVHYVALKLAASLQPYLSTLQGTHQPKTLHR